MRNPLLAPEIRELLQEGRQDDLRQLLEELHPNDAAAYLAALSPDEIGQALELLPSRLERDVFCYFDPEVQEEIVLGAGRSRVKALLKALPSDERYEFLDRLDDRVKNSLVPLLEQAARADFLRREQYEDDQVGSILSTEYCALKPGMTVVEALAELRRQEPSRETIYYAYVVDDDKRLLGFVSLRDLITARDRERIGDLMKAEPVQILVSDDQEEAARLIREYDLLALPVVDEDRRLVGIVTYDDAADIEEEEGTEDIELMAGVTGEAEEPGGYLAEPVWSQIRRRMPLLAFLAMFNLTTAMVIHHFEGSLEYAILLALLPVVMATGGMVGGQASSLIIRGLTVGDVEPKAVRAVVWKELRVCLGMAAVLSAIIFGEGVLLAQLDDDIPSTGRMLAASLGMAMAMAAHVVGAGLFGVTVPIAAKALGRDPATVSTPAVTAIADLTGASIFCGIVLTVLA
jgi:magnesium transporter